jgi:hypothetical protein
VISSARGSGNLWVIESPAAEPEKDHWKFRRRTIVGYLTFCTIAASLIGIFGNPDNRIHTMMADNVFWSAAIVVLFYIGAPIADDWLKTRKSTI